MIKEKIFEIFSDVLDIDIKKISLETKSSEIKEWDSVATVNIVVALEDEFDVKFKLEEIQDLKKIKDFFDLLEKNKK